MLFPKPTFPAYVPKHDSTAQVIGLVGDMSRNMKGSGTKAWENMLYCFLGIRSETDISSINIYPTDINFDAKKLKEWGFENKKLSVKRLNGR